jgi:DNA polymerase-4
LPKDGEAIFFPSFFSNAESNRLYSSLLKNTQWQQNQIKMYGKISMRKIIHIDMDAFYASVEQRDDPVLRGKPVAVGGSSNRGVVAAASYEARKFGVRSAMASKIAAQQCPNLIFVHPNFEKYKTVSKQIMNIFHRFTDLVEPLSLDEAYLDVTENKMNIPLATDIAQQIKQLIKAETQLTASAGVSYCKFLAKIASGHKKPDGLVVITPNMASTFIEQLPIGDFWGIGKVTAAKMQQLGIRTGKDLKALAKDKITSLFGEKSGDYYYKIARGIDDRPVENNRIRKSIGAEETFEKDITDVEVMKEKLEDIAADVSRRCLRNNATGKTIRLKIKYHDFAITTRSRTVDHFIETKEEITMLSQELLIQPEPPLKSVRLLGITISNLNTDLNTVLLPNP